MTNWTNTSKNQEKAIKPRKGTQFPSTGLIACKPQKIEVFFKTE